MRAAARAGFAAAALAFSGCAAGPVYHWGHYEQLVYEMYAEPGKADPAVQIERLGRDVAEADAAGRPVPPGVRLHLGYMHLLGGDAAAARAEFERERQAFPESAVFVERLLAGMERP